MVEKLKQYLKDTNYPTDLIIAASKMTEEDADNLLNLLHNFDYADYEIKYMINHPDCINAIRWQCTFQASINKFYHDLMIKESTL